MPAHLPPNAQSAQHSHQGFITLTVILVLLVALTTLTLTVARSSKTEQAIASNDIRAQEIQAAAEASLDYAMAWANQHPIPWSSASDTEVNCGTDPGCPTFPAGLVSTDGGSFIVTIRFQRHTANAKFIKISTIAYQPDNEASATASCFIDPLGTLIPGTWRDF